MKLKRVFAYLIDLFIVSFVTSLICLLPMFSEAQKGSEEYSQFIIETMKGTGSGELDLDLINEKMYENTKAILPITILRLGVLLLYFGVFAFINGGVTLGKKLMKIKIVSSDDGKELNPGLFMLREVIKNSVVFEIINIIAVLVLPLSTFIPVTNVVANLEQLVLFIILGVMIFREDERGLHDLIARTKVISTKTEK